jgi:hypothetical protein
MITITAAASTISFGSSRFRFIENLHKLSLFTTEPGECQYQTSGFGKLVRIDRLLNQSLPAPKDQSGSRAERVPKDPVRRPFLAK